MIKRKSNFWICREDCATLLAAFILTASTAQADWRDAQMAKARLHSERIAQLCRAYVDAPLFHQLKKLEESYLKETLACLSGKRAPKYNSGTHLEAYICEIDDSPQPFWVYVPHRKVTAPGLLVYLHGYNPDLDVVTAPAFPVDFVAIAEKTGAFIVAPFGRGNTDYQHIGEKDVLRVIDEMRKRHNIDPEKIVLSGHSMGGLGVWCIAARHAHLPNALVIFSGHGDFYTWHGLSHEEIPSWQRKLIDHQFATAHVPNLVSVAITAVHGQFDDIVSYEQGRFLPRELERLGSKKMKFITLSHGGHDIFSEAAISPEVVQTLIFALTSVNPKPKVLTSQPPFPGATGSKIMDALLSPFMLVAGKESFDGYSHVNFKARIAEWVAFAHATPRAKTEMELTRDDVDAYNLIVFGEPETSPLIRHILKDAGFKIFPEHFEFSGKLLPRKQHGLLAAFPSPFATNRTVVVQCGTPYAPNQSPNHRFDRIPDIICYSEESDKFGYPVAREAGFFISPRHVDWSANPMTDAITRPLDYILTPPDR